MNLIKYILRLIYEKDSYLHIRKNTYSDHLALILKSQTFSNPIYCTLAHLCHYLSSGAACRASSKGLLFSSGL